MALREAASMAAAGRWRLAAETTQKCVSAEPNNLTAQVLYGICLYETRQIEDAVNVLERAAERAPDNFAANYFSGWVLCESGQHGQALVPLKRAHKLQPAHPDVLILLARCCLAQNLPEGTGYLQALRRHRNFATSPECYNALGVMWVQQQQYTNALRDLQTAASHAPEDPVVLQNLAVLHDQYLRSPKEALRYYRLSLTASQQTNDKERAAQISHRLKQMAEEKLGSSFDQGPE